jgi:hypothetical protein
VPVTCKTEFDDDDDFTQPDVLAFISQIESNTLYKFLKLKDSKFN